MSELRLKGITVICDDWFIRRCAVESPDNFPQNVVQMNSMAARFYLKLPDALFRSPACGNINSGSIGERQMGGRMFCAERLGGDLAHRRGLQRQDHVQVMDHQVDHNI
ncbi:MAG: hypothetical protein RLN70_06965, partial [Rhodospirillaceae bacterium]